MSRYLIDAVYNGRAEKVLDRRGFAADLAKHLDGATLEPCDPMDAGRIEYQTATLQVGELSIRFGKDGYNVNKLARVRVECGASRAVRSRLSGIRSPHYPSATYDTGRPLDVLAKAIKRDIIDAAQHSLAADLQTVAAMDSDRAALSKQRARILKAFPAASIPEPDEKGNPLGFYASGDGFSLSARLTREGRLYVDRLSYDGDALTLLTFLLKTGAK